MKIETKLYIHLILTEKEAGVLKHLLHKYDPATLKEKFNFFQNEIDLVSNLIDLLDFEIKYE